MKMMMKNIKNKISTVFEFLRHDIWKLSIKDISKTRAFLINQLKILLFAVREFRNDNCFLRASALTFYSLLSFVPIIAMLFGIAKGFGFQEKLEQQLMNQFQEHETVMTQVINFSNSLLESTQGGLIAGIGLLILLYSVLKLLNNIEDSFNDIWEVKTSRTLARKFSDYISIVIICPITILISSSANVFITTQVTSLTEEVELLNVVGPFLFFLLQFLPYVLIWALFAFIYIAMPNTKIDFKSGIIAGIIAGTIYQITQGLYISFQIGVAKYNAIYGSFAALPLFLIWLQLSWLIVLWGAEVSFSIQNVKTYQFTKNMKNISALNRRLLSLLVAHKIIQIFIKGEKPLTEKQLANSLGIPFILVNQIISSLVESEIISKVHTNERFPCGYQPAKNIDLLSIKYVIDSLDKYGDTLEPNIPDECVNKLSESLNKFSAELDNSKANRLLKDI